MGLDFSKLNALGTPDIKIKEELSPDDAKSLRGLTQEQQQRQQMLAVYREYEKHKRLSGELRADIIKGVKAGENHSKLLIKAVKMISLMTGDDFYYKMLEPLISEQVGNNESK